MGYRSVFRRLSGGWFDDEFTIHSTNENQCCLLHIILEVITMTTFHAFNYVQGPRHIKASSRASPVFTQKEAAVPLDCIKERADMGRRLFPQWHGLEHSLRRVVSTALLDARRGSWLLLDFPGYGGVRPKEWWRKCTCVVTPPPNGLVWNPLCAKSSPRRSWRLLVARGCSWTFVVREESRRRSGGVYIYIWIT